MVEITSFDAPEEGKKEHNINEEIGGTAVYRLTDGKNNLTNVGSGATFHKDAQFPLDYWVSGLTKDGRPVTMMFEQKWRDGHLDAERRAEGEMLNIGKHSELIAGLKMLRYFCPERQWKVFWCAPYAKDNKMYIWDLDKYSKEYLETTKKTKFKCKHTDKAFKNGEEKKMPFNVYLLPYDGASERDIDVSDILLDGLFNDLNK